MLTPKEFVNLLSQTEGPTLDFKRDPYDLKTEEDRGGLIKRPRCKIIEQGLFADYSSR
jgi:hypothetical protein